METRPSRRAVLMMVVVASALAGVVGCASARTPSADPPKKEYPWKDMSLGSGLYRPRTPPPAE